MANESDNRVRKFSFSSEKPVGRWFGDEILDHKPGSVRMEFFRSGRAPFLLYHDTRQPIGVITAASIDGDKMGRGAARFGRTDAANDALLNVDDAILTNTSVGYRVHELVLERQSKDAGDTYRVTDWEPLEVSLVGVPADTSVGMGRKADIADAHTELPAPDRIYPIPEIPVTTRAQAAKETTMTQQVNAAAGANADAQKITAVQAEKERRESIGYLCKTNKIDSRVEARWIEEGTTLNQVARELVDVMEERGKARPALAAELGLSAIDTKKYSLFRAIRALKFGAGNPRLVEEAAFEMECSRAVAKQLGRELTSSILIPAEVLTRSLPSDVMQRAMSVVPGGSGGYLVNVENMGFIDILRARSVALRMGARRLSGLQGNVTFGRQTGKGSVTWQGGEGVSVTATDQTLGQLSMTPKTAIAITDVSEQLLRQSSISAEAFVMADLAADIAIDGVDNAAINGTGGAQPLGIKNTTGITSGQSASTFSYTKALAFPVAAGSVNAIRGNPGWVTNIAGAAIAMQRQRFTSTDSPLWEGNLLDGTLVGFRAMSSEQLAANNIIFGSWDELVIGEWGVLELAMDNGGTRFNQAQVGIRAMYMVDIMLRYPQAFVVGTDLS
jgi:HK97 family phage major capsid protein/HK97 family phage prohead protease